eukprot:gene25265-10915_t
MRRLRTQFLVFLNSPNGKLLSAGAIFLAIIETCVLLSIMLSPKEGPVKRVYYPVDLPNKGPAAFTAPVRARSGDCTLHHIDYIPTKDELEWTANARLWEENYCDHLYDYGNTIHLWLEYQEQMMQGTDITLTSPRYLDVFSRYVYNFNCSEGKSKLEKSKLEEAWIEPLFGSLRHPWALCPGMPESDKPINENPLLYRSYLLLGSVQMPSFFHGRLNFYFDLGASTYSDGFGGPSQSWIVESYKKRGIKFDRLLMWEAGATDPAEIFKSVPAELQHAYQFFIIPMRTDLKWEGHTRNILKRTYFNIPVGTDFRDEGNPLNIMKRIVKPEDFLVLKLDMENSQVEAMLVAHILSDSHVPFLIDEMFYEHHVNFPLMNGYWGTQNETTYITPRKLCVAPATMRSDGIDFSAPRQLAEEVAAPGEVNMEGGYEPDYGVEDDYLTFSELLPLPKPAHLVYIKPTVAVVAVKATRQSVGIQMTALNNQLERPTVAVVAGKATRQSVGIQMTALNNQLESPTVAVVAGKATRQSVGIQMTALNNQLERYVIEY